MTLSQQLERTMVEAEIQLCESQRHLLQCKHHWLISILLERSALREKERYGRQQER